MTKDEVIALVREIGGPDRADPVCAQGDMITLDVDEVVRLVNIAAAQQAEQATQLNQSLGLYEPERVPIHMERVDKSTSQHWWNEQAGIRMPSPELYTRGDTVLCWVNEGELLAYLSGITGDAK